MTSYQTSSSGGTLFGREPALVLAAIAGILNLAVGFGLDLTAEQVSLIGAAAAAIVGLLVRRKVYPEPHVLDIVGDDTPLP